jgi:hypothetical protein
VDSDDYVLRGIAFCAKCGSALYTRRYATGRHYLCGAVREARGTCNAERIPAELAEAQVLNHLDSFIGSVEEWLAGLVTERHAERHAYEAAVERERVRLAELGQQRDRHLHEYRRLVDEGDRLARLALEEVERIDVERADQERAVVEAEAVLSEWSQPPDVDAALDFYAGLVDLIRGRVKRADGAQALNAALHDVVEGIWFEIEPDRERLLAEFELRGQPAPTLPGGVPVPAEFRQQRPTLPPMRYDVPLHLVEPDGSAKPDASP